MTDPRFQWSVFTGPNRSEQFVVRADDFEDFNKSRDLIRKLLASSATEPKHTTYGDEEAEWNNRVGAEARVNVDELPMNPQVKTVNATNPYEETPDEAHVCTIHHKQMKERQNRKTGGTFWDHRMKDEAGNWLACVGKGYVPSNF